MGKLANSMIIGVIIWVVLFFFNGLGVEPTDLFSLLLNPSDWETNPFWTTLTGFSLAGGILIGLGIVIRQDWLTRAGMIATVSTITLAPYVRLFTFVSGQVNNLSFCATSPVCSQLNSIGGFGQIVALVFVGPMFFYALWACVSWIFSPEPSG